MYVPVTTAPPAPPSREAQELAELLTAATEAYQLKHPHMSPLEVRVAMRLAQKAAGGADNKMAIKGVLFGLIAFMGVALLLLRLNWLPGDATQSIPWALIAIVGLAVVAAGVAIVKKRE